MKTSFISTSSLKGFFSPQGPGEWAVHIQPDPLAGYTAIGVAFGYVYEDEVSAVKSKPFYR
jgi:hypothetical protein